LRSTELEGNTGDAMSEQQSARHMLDQAEHAAMAGDLASADELLRSAARIQEAELGPLHPDLANTLNNLAIVAERTGRTSEAETLYRRAAAIAAAALPSDHPMVAESRQNLEDFCRARGLSIDAPAVVAPTKAAPPPSTAPPPEPGSRTTASAQPPQPAATSAGASHSLAWVATGAVILIAAIFLLLRPSSSHDTPAPAATPEPAAAQPADAAPIDAPPIAAPPVTPAPIEQTAPPKTASRGDDRNTSTNKSPATGDITVATAQLCRVFSTSGGNWRCDPVGDSPTPGPLVFYTRVRSPEEAAVEHRWYRRGTLRQSVKLRIQANATDGYRTYSRQRVDDGDWRVEVRSTDGHLLLEQRFAVR
jgi:hypothetical protein